MERKAEKWKPMEREGKEKIEKRKGSQQKQMEKETSGNKW